MSKLLQDPESASDPKMLKFVVICIMDNIGVKDFLITHYFNYVNISWKNSKIIAVIIIKIGRGTRTGTKKYSEMW